MLSDSQSSAHRVQPPPRSKARWQPYSYQSSGSAASDTNTPKPSVPPTPLPSVTPISLTNQFPKELIQRDVGKQKYALGLIDQAVKTLCEIWRPEDIPNVFIGPPKGSPSCSLTPSSQSSMQSLVSTGAETDSALLPLKNFVHEVLKRSRTSGSVMQTALCYLEAVRPQVPGILRDENLGIRSYFMPESTILPATEAELQMDQKLSNLEVSHAVSTSDERPKTVRMTDEDVDVASRPGEMSSMNQPTSPLPSPLLCPRRTFLASLILACKFSQDKCYSNRAWAKLSGLPPREIGRCERALGQALDWRLWVGKKASTSRDIANPVIMSVPAGPSRPIVRTQSESCIHSLREPFLRPSDPKRPDPPPPCPNLEAPAMAAAGGAWTGTGLHRCSTAPTGSFTDSRLPPMRPAQVPYASSDSSSSVSSLSSPKTPPLYSPSISGDRTLQISSYEDGMFPSISQSKLDPVYSASPSSFFADTKLCGSTAVSTPHAEESKLTAMQLQLSLADSISESLWGSRLGIVTGSHLWHADGGHLSLGSAPVH